MRWRNPDDENAHDVEAHAQICTSGIVRAVKSRGRASVESAVEGVVLDALRQAFRAGQRYGAAEARHRLDSVVRDAVESALSKVRAGVRAPCPDCDGRGCDECRGTGYFDQRARA